MLVQIQCISQITRSVGNKLNQNFNALVPTLSEYACRLDENNSNDIDNEISEAALIAIENLVRKCSSEAKNSIGPIFKIASHCLVYDPNYHYNDNDDEEMVDES